MKVALLLTVLIASYALTDLCGTALEECDDGNAIDHDGCSAKCRLESRYGRDCNLGSCWTTCGDGVKATGHEECDDGNQSNGDGCSKYCEIEVGWICPMNGALCTNKFCGNGIKELGEECDDGNEDNTDSCNNMCFRRKSIYERFLKKNILENYIIRT